MLSLWFKLSKQLWPHHEASLCLFCSSRLPATPGFTLCPSSSGSWTDGPASIQHPLHEQGWQTAESTGMGYWQSSSAELEPGKPGPWCCAPAEPWAAPCQPCPAGPHKHSHLSPVPAPHLVDSNLSKTTPLCSLSSLTLQGSAKNWISSSSPGVRVKIQRQKFLPYAEAFSLHEWFQRCWQWVHRLFILHLFSFHCPKTTFPLKWKGA